MLLPVPERHLEEQCVSQQLHQPLLLHLPLPVRLQLEVVVRCRQHQVGQSRPLQWNMFAMVLAARVFRKQFHLLLCEVFAAVRLVL
jgi:hypothetical protein